MSHTFHKTIRSSLVIALIGSITLSLRAQEPTEAASIIQQQSAIRTQSAAKQMLLAVTRAGSRIVAVGEHGNILISDDQGASFRQAKAVPTRTTLTSVSFSDALNGWAVGQWGVIIHTEDGGETWTLQRSDTSVDRPLYSVLFLNKEHGFAVGLWSLMLETKDGGKTWQDLLLPTPPEGGNADRNLFQLFSGDGNTLYIAAERGTVIKSVDNGATWQYLNTEYAGSFWTGAVLKNGTLVLAGLRGTVYISQDGGTTWRLSKTENKSSITSIIQVGNLVRGVGLDGVMIESHDNGESFSMTQRSDRLPLTGLVDMGTSSPVIISKMGVTSEKFAPP